MTVCSVDDCERTDCRRFKGTDLFCNRHYMQMYTYGKILPKTRSVNDPNEFTIEEELCKISIYNRKCELICHTLIDLDNVEECKPIKWYLTHSGYIKNDKVGYLHKLIMKVPSNIKIDHINRNPLDNRKQNLRICNYSENTCNTGITINNTSGYKGVSWNSSSGKWLAQIIKDAVQYYLGVFAIKEDAARAYNKASLELHGPFGYQNIIKPKLNRRLL